MEEVIVPGYKIQHTTPSALTSRPVKLAESVVSVTV